MKLHQFIAAHLDDILAEWTAFARRNAPPEGHMSTLALSDHAAGILRAIAIDIRTAQSPAEQFEKSQGEAPDLTPDESAAAIHGRLRHASNFSLLQLSSEYRALRATVLRLWLPHVAHMSESTMQEMVRFNEAIDQALAESIVTYSARADQTRELFLAILGHDLRAPLSTVSLAGNLLSHPGTTVAQAQDAGARITRCSALMGTMISDLLGFTRKQMGGDIPMAPQPLDIVATCRSAAEDASAMYPGCEIRLHAEGDTSGCFDQVRLHQLVTNLLINAAQYGAKGKPIELSLYGEAEALRFEVRNLGPVIPAPLLKSLFQPLVQLEPEDPAELRPRTSMGLGLYIAFESTAAHGGALTVTSDASQGTIFTARFPRAAMPSCA